VARLQYGSADLMGLLVRSGRTRTSSLTRATLCTTTPVGAVSIVSPVRPSLADPFRLPTAWVQTARATPSTVVEPTLRVRAAALRATPTRERSTSGARSTAPASSERTGQSYEVKLRCSSVRSD
jgi:hypothetical protein